VTDNDPSALGPDNYPTPSSSYPAEYYYQSYRYHAPGAGGPGMPAAEFQTIESIHWQLQNERPDNASTLSGTYSMVHIRIGMIQNGIVSAYNGLGDWTSPEAKDAFRQRVSRTYWDLHHIAQKVDEVRAALSDLAQVMQNGQTDMQDLYDEYLEAMSAWDAAKLADADIVPGEYTYGVQDLFPTVGEVEEQYLGRRISGIMSADRDVFKAEWDRRAQEKRDQIGGTYTDAIGKLAGSIPIVRVLDTHPHPEISSSDPLPALPTTAPGPSPGTPGTPAPPAPAPAPVPGQLLPAQMVLTPAPPVPPPPQNPGPGPGPGQAPGGPEAPPAPAPTAPTAPALPGGPGAGGPAGAPGLLAPGLAPVTPGGLGTSPTRGQAPTAPSLIAATPNANTLSTALTGVPADPAAAIGPQPPGSVITSPASADLASPPALPPGMGMPPGMGRPAPGMPNRQQPQRPGEPAQQRGPGTPAMPALPELPGQAGGMPPGLPSMPAMPGQAGRMPPGAGMPPGAQPPTRNQRTQQPTQPGLPGIPATTPQAFAPPTTGAPPVLGNPQQRRGQRQPGSPAEAPPAAPGSRRPGTSGIDGGTPPILSNLRYTGPRPTHTEQRDARRHARRERTRRLAELLKSQLTKGIPTGTAPVLEGPAPVDPAANRITEVPPALRARQPTPRTDDRHTRPEPPADRTTRRVLPERPAPATAERPPTTTDQEAWEVETPGGPVVASDKPKPRRSNPPPTLGTRG